MGACFAMAARFGFCCVFCLQRLSAASRLENCTLVCFLLRVPSAADLARASARSVAASYKPSMLVTRVRLPACALGSCNVRLFCFVSWPGSRAGRHFEVSPGALRVHNRRFTAGLSRRHVGHVHLPFHVWLCVCACVCNNARRRGGIEPLHVSMPRELKSRPGTSPTHSGCCLQRRVLLSSRTLQLCYARLQQIDSEGIRTPAGRAQWISSPSP